MFLIIICISLIHMCITNNAKNTIFREERSLIVVVLKNKKKNIKKGFMFIMPVTIFSFNLGFFFFSFLDMWSKIGFLEKYFCLTIIIEKYFGAIGSSYASHLLKKKKKFHHSLRYLLSYYMKFTYVMPFYMNLILIVIYKRVNFRESIENNVSNILHLIS